MAFILTRLKADAPIKTKNSLSFLILLSKINLKILSDVYF